MDHIIEVNNLTKLYPLVKNQPGLKEWIIQMPRFRKNKGYFTALDSISFNIKRGECIGVVGQNGAGKSTLLSLLLGTSYPTSGEIKVFGKRTPLLELGSGFHPDLTGRENVLINAVLLGLTRQEALARLDAIVKFSEIESFIDMPVRTYSSGMYLRLAFSVAIHTDPEVLLIDEILAVGDESFQKKSGDALISLIKGGVTTVFVSHNLEAVQQVCTRALWLDQGQLMKIGNPVEVTEAYRYEVDVVRKKQKEKLGELK
jgi:ABC-type polysaccharide/polyol phosphate transport system ATPase subunit